MNLAGIDFDKARVITFDAAGTLLAPHPGVGEIYAEVARHHGRDIDADLLETRFRRTFKQLRGHPRAIVNEATERVFWFEVVRRCFMPECPLPETQEIFADLWEEFAHGRRWRVLPGVEETLERFAENEKLLLAVLSNWDSRLHRVLGELNLARFFSHVFISSEIGVEKPALRAFRIVEAALDLPAAVCLHVGDSYSTITSPPAPPAGRRRLSGRHPTARSHRPRMCSRLGNYWQETGKRKLES